MLKEKQFELMLFLKTDHLHSNIMWANEITIPVDIFIYVA